MKRTWYYLPLLFLPVVAHAQSALDVNVNFGSAWNSASGAGLYNLNPNSPNPLGPCIPGTAFCQATPSLSGFFLGFGGDIMFREHFGAGAQVNFQPVHQDYGPIQSRQTFIDVDGIYEPLISKRAIVRLQAGIGSAKTGFIVSQPSCVGTGVVCSTQSAALGSSSHFQVHFAAGVQIPIKERFFIRPQFDLHYVPNFTDQWGSNWAPEATIAVGYHFGEH